MLSMKKILLVLMVGGIILFAIQYRITDDCFLQNGKLGFLSCEQVNNEQILHLEETELFIETKNSTILVNVEIANEPEERTQGLMFRQNLDWDNGMFFVFEEERKLSFWMKNTLIPLDMLFIDKNFKIVEIKENVPPCKEDICPNYPSEIPAKYVLEVNGGFVIKNNIEVGDKVSYSTLEKT